MNEIVKRHISCPECTSSDAYCVYEDGSGYCYSCTYYKPKERNNVTEVVDFRPYPHRGLSQNTMNKYNILVRFEDDKPVEVGFKYPKPETFKIRSLEDKKFFTKGNMRGPMLYGSDLFERGGDAIIITEGEYDAASAYQTTLIPSVSVKSAASAKVDVKNDWDYINSFKKIILAFDTDDPGQKAAREVASLFDFNKVVRASFTKYKDANEYLQNNETNSLREAILNASKYTPENIISSFSEVAKSLSEAKEERIGTYPFTGLQSSLFGIHRGESIVFKGDEGIGKTEVFRAIENHLLQENKNNKIGILHLEEDQSVTIKGVANYYSKYPFLHPETATNNDEILEAYRDAVGNADDRLFLYDSFDVEDDTSLIDNIRFLVSACGCQFIFLDHISWLATGQEQQEDERRKLDKISQRLKILAKELGFAIIMISHTNDDGKTRGSRNITKVANTVIHLSRDKVNPVEALRLRTNFTVEKSRITGGKSGPAGYAMYNSEICVLEDPEVESKQ